MVNVTKVDFLWMMYTLSLDMFNGVYKNNKGAAEFFFLSFSSVFLKRRKHVGMDVVAK